MKNESELQHIIYSILVTQIQFGTFRFGERLPTIEEASQLLVVSVDTVRAAYLQLKKDGYISLMKTVGAVVRVQYDEQEIEGHIQTFFSLRMEEMTDLCQALGSLFNQSLWLALKLAPPEVLDQMEQTAVQQNLLAPYRMIQHLHQIFGVLGNDLLLRLTWHTFLFFHVPFLSIPENVQYFGPDSGILLEMIRFCRQKDWAALWHAVQSFETLLTSSLRHFFETRITMPPGEPQVTLRWSSYKKSSQRCYSLGMELLTAFRLGDYPVGSLLPSLENLAKEKHVSISTLRRTLSLLNNIGAVRSINGVGTRVLSLSQSSQNSDFSQPIVQKRLLDFATSLQILALTCRDTAESMVASLDAETASRYKEQLLTLQVTYSTEAAIYFSLKFISLSSPSRTVRMVYTELIKQLIWGYPLRSLHGAQETIQAFYFSYTDYFADCLGRADEKGFSRELEKLLIYEVKFTVEHLVELGIKDAAAIVIPESRPYSDSRQ